MRGSGTFMTIFGGAAVGPPVMYESTCCTAGVAAARDDVPPPLVAVPPVAAAACRACSSTAASALARPAAKRGKKGVFTADGCSGRWYTWNFAVAYRRPKLVKNTSRASRRSGPDTDRAPDGNLKYPSVAATMPVANDDEKVSVNVDG